MNLDAVLGEVLEQADAARNRGHVADYIPSLSSVDPTQFGIAVATASGSIHVAGDADVPFSIQSISKVFALTLALQRLGDGLWQRVGREPSGAPFNSIALVEQEAGMPRNPFVNVGALVIVDVNLAGRMAAAGVTDLLTLVRVLASDPSIDIDEDVARSEQVTGFRNAALCNCMRAFGTLEHEVDETLEAYFHQCAIAMSCRQLALSGRYLMLNGRDAETGEMVLTAAHVRAVHALMLTCGHYDGSGEFACRVGLPGKSGVGGGILAIVPGVASIAAWSPGLDRRGNSMLATAALEQLAERVGWSLLNGPPPQARLSDGAPE